MSTETTERVGDTLEDFSDCLDILTTEIPHTTEDEFFATFNANELSSIVETRDWHSGTKKKNTRRRPAELDQDQEEAEVDKDDRGISSLSIGSYNTSTESANPVRVVGPGGNMFQKRLMCASSDYTKTKLKTTRASMISITQSFTECALPLDVVEAASQRYFDVQNAGTIIRGNVHSGAMACCLMRMCDIAGIHKKRDMFARMFGISLSDLSAGERLIDGHVVEGRLKREDFQTQNSEMSNVKAYTIQYFLKLGITLPTEATTLSTQDGKSDEVDEDGKIDKNIKITNENRYYLFVRRLIRFTIKFKVADNSVEYSKCAGAIHVLVSRASDLNISADRIAQECTISKSTFRRFSNTITDLLNSTNEREVRLKAKLTHLFNTHGIPTILKSSSH